MHARKLAVPILFLSVISQNALSSPLDKFDLSGFFTLAATQTDNDEKSSYSNSLAEDDLLFNTRDTRFGLQLSATVNPKFSVVSQFLSTGDDNFDLVTDWAYIDFKPSEKFKIHAGKFKIPQLLVSDYIAVGYAYPWVRPPEDVYSINPLTSTTGVDLLFSQQLGGINLLLQLYAGTGDHDIYLPARAYDVSPALQAVGLEKGEKVRLETHDMYGGSFEMRSDVFTFRVGYFQTEVDVPGTPINDSEGDFSSAGFTLDWNDIVVYSEYVIRNADDKSVVALADQEAWYATLGYRFKKMLPYVTYSEINEGDDKSALALKQHTVALGMRFELAENAALKLEALKADPDNNNHGLFDDPVDDGKVYTVTMDVIF